VAQLTLQNGAVAIVDEDVREWLGLYDWHYHGKPIRVRRRLGPQKARLDIHLHRQIAGVPDFCFVGLRTTDGLDCRRENILILDTAEHEINWSSNTAADYASGSVDCWKGVSWNKDRGLWNATVCGLFIGEFAMESDAARAYNAKAIELWGEKAELNVIPFLSRELANSMPQKQERKYRAGGATGKFKLRAMKGTAA